MPIRPELRALYRGPQWQAKRERCFHRANNKCERCRKPRHQWVYTWTWQEWALLSGRRVRQYRMVWIALDGRTWRNEQGRVCSPYRAKGLPRKIRVRLSCAHLDGDSANMSDGNFAALCDWCHLMHDRGFHRFSRAARKDRARPLLAAVTP